MLVQALGNYLDVILKKFAVQTVHIFMHQFSKPFDLVYAKKSCVELDVIKSESIFIDGSILKTKVARMFTKAKHVINAINKAQSHLDLK